MTEPQRWPFAAGLSIPASQGIEVQDCAPGTESCQWVVQYHYNSPIRTRQVFLSFPVSVSREHVLENWRGATACMPAPEGP